jgi:hypothetical protein
MGQAEAQVSEQETPYLIPQTVYVGDRARLVAPLGPAFSNVEAFIMEGTEAFRPSEDLIINRIAVEHRGGQTRLLIDFIAYRPGVLELPPLGIPSLALRGFPVSGIQVHITSILSGDSLVLSPAVPPLVVPGTITLIYGTVASLVLLALLGLGIRLWGRGSLQQLGECFRRWRLIRFMKKRLQHLRTMVEGAADGHDAGELLALVSSEFRGFLTLFTGINCRALAAGEFTGLPPLVVCDTQAPDDQGIVTGTFLAGIFRRCDTLRFSGTGISREALLDMLDGLEHFIDALEEVEKQSHRGKGAPLQGALAPKGAA